MPSSIKVSFVLPVYNMEKFLCQCLDSLLGQTLKEIEIICVDDGSIDGSLALLREYEKKDKRLSVYENKIESFGAAIPRNVGLSHASGEYVLILDSDDYVDVTLAEKTYDVAVKTDADVVLFDVVKFDSDTGKKIPCNQFLNQSLLPESESFSPESLADRLFLLGDGVAWNKLFRRSLIEAHGLAFFPVHVVDDMNFTFSALVMAQKITVLPEVLLFYRVGNTASQMANLHRDPLTPVKVLEKLREFLLEKNLYSIYEKTYLERGLGLCMFYFDGLTKKEDFSLLYDSLQKEGELSLGFERNRLFLLDNPVKQQWIVDVYALSAEEFQAKKKRETEHILRAGKNYGIFGFGTRTSLIYEKIKGIGGHCVGIADSSLEKQGQIFQGLTVLSPKALKEVSLDLVLISSPNYYEEMKANLLSLGFEAKQIALI